MRVAFDEAGQGDTAVLLLHGIGGGRSIWGAGGSGTLQALADGGFHALALDFPGYGDSPGQPGMDSFVAAVLAVVDPDEQPATVMTAATKSRAERFTSSPLGESRQHAN